MARLGPKARDWRQSLAGPLLRPRMRGNSVNQQQEKAQKANRAASAIGTAMEKTLADLRPTFAVAYDLDDQLVTLAIAKAAMGIAAGAASAAIGMATDECDELEDRLNDVVYDAINELEAKSDVTS